MNPKPENPTADRQAKLSKQHAPTKYQKKCFSYWGGKGRWTKVQKNGLFLFTLNPSVKIHRQNFKKRFFNNDAKNRKIKKQEL